VTKSQPSVRVILDERRRPSPEHVVAYYNLAVLYDEHDSLALASDHYHAF
jgi:hypothetical protein